MKKRLIYVDQPQKKVRTIASENELFLAMDSASEFITTMSFMAMNLSWCLFVCTSWASTCNFGNPYYMLFEYSNFFFIFVMLGYVISLLNNHKPAI